MRNWEIEIDRFRREILTQPIMLREGDSRINIGEMRLTQDNSGNWRLTIKMPDGSIWDFVGTKRG